MEQITFENAILSKNLASLLIHREAVRQGENFEVQVQHKRDKVLQAFEDLNLPRQNIYFVTNFHEGRRGCPRVWEEGDRGLNKACKIMVNIARDLVTVAVGLPQVHLNYITIDTCTTM